MITGVAILNNCYWCWNEVKEHAWKLQESVVTTIVKLSLKSLHEFVRLQTFNRSGFQQIQLDIQFLRVPLKEIVEDEAAIDFLLDEVIPGFGQSTAF